MAIFPNCLIAYSLAYKEGISNQ